MQSDSALGLDALLGSGDLACAGSPKEAQRRSLKGCGGVWFIFCRPRRVLEAAAARVLGGSIFAALAPAAHVGSGEALAEVWGPARRLRDGSEWIFLVLAFLVKRAALHHCAWAPNQLVSFAKLVGARQVHGRSPGLLTRLN